MLTRQKTEGKFGSRRRLAFGLAFTALALAGMALAAVKLTSTSWPLEKANWWMVALAIVAYFFSFVFRAMGWQRMFASHETPPTSARCLASVGAAAASGVVLPFRLDYLVKIGIFRRLGDGKCRIGLESIGLSIVALGLVDAVAMLPLSISATATTTNSFRVPLAIVVFCGFGAAALLLLSRRLLALSWVARRRRLSRLAEIAAVHLTLSRATLSAWLCLVACWSTRAIGTAALLSALGIGFSFPIALAILCLGAAAAVVPLTAGGAVANVGATAGVLLALGVGREQALNFSLASGMLLSGTALVAALLGGLIAVTALLRPRLSLAFGRPA